MNYRRINWLLAIYFLLPCLIATAQLPDTITLDYCYRQAEINYPLSRQSELLLKTDSLRLKNLGKNWLPQTNINGSGSLQSDVTEVTIDLPAGLPNIGVPPIARDQYRLTLDVNQPIYDAHTTYFQKQVERINLEADKKNLQVQLYQLKDQVNQLYFNILFLQENEELINSSRQQLESKQQEIKSAVANGTQLQSNEDALEAEILLADQKLIAIKEDRIATFKMLSQLILKAIPETAHLILPEVSISNYDYENKRFEYQLYDIQQGKADIMKNMVTTKWNPRVYAFGQLGYGRPGFNMLSNDFTTFWIFGGKLSWNIWNWNQNKNEKKIYDLQKEIILTQKETFDKNLRMATDKNLSEILKLTGILIKDEDIIRLRTRIATSASSQLTNGVINSSDYVNRLNEATQAKLNRELHKIQLVKAKLYYLYTLGRLK
jgi:outer membrane protein TolC